MLRGNYLKYHFLNNKHSLNSEEEKKKSAAFEEVPLPFISCSAISPHRVSLNKISEHMNNEWCAIQAANDRRRGASLSEQLGLWLAAGLTDHRLETTPSARWLVRRWWVRCWIWSTDFEAGLLLKGELMLSTNRERDRERMFSCNHTHDAVEE